MLNSDLHGEAFNFGPPANQDMTVLDLIEKMQEFWPKGEWNVTADQSNVKEAGLLKLNCDKSLALLSWQPTLNFHETVEFTTSWYQEYYNNKKLSMFDYSLEQINRYVKRGRQQKRVWSDGN